MVPAKSICKTGTRECVVRTSGNEKTRHRSAFSCCRWDHASTHPNFQRENEKKIKKLRIPEEFVVKTQEKAWMDEGLMDQSNQRNMSLQRVRVEIV